MAFIVQAFADGKVGDILFTSAKIAFANAVNFLAGALMAVAQALWQALVESIKNAITLFQIVTRGERAVVNWPLVRPRPWHEYGA